MRTLILHRIAGLAFAATAATCLIPASNTSAKGPTQAPLMIEAAAT